ncbi:MAG: hypothetical protein MUO89_08030 [Dehalococcoidia bacterium]|nr:hypothetical protein [Dehalococcoidia bacterium]
MPGKAPNVSNKKIDTVEAIKELLKRQRKETERSTLVIFGGAVIIAGLSFVVTSMFPDPAPTYVGVFLITLGALFMILVGPLWK